MIYTPKINNGFNSVFNFTNLIDAVSLWGLPVTVSSTSTCRDLVVHKHWFLKSKRCPASLLPSTLASSSAFVGEQLKPLKVALYGVVTTEF